MNRPVIAHIEKLGPRPSPLLDLLVSLGTVEDAAITLGKRFSTIYILPAGTYLRLLRDQALGLGLKYCAWDLLTAPAIHQIQSGEACLILDTILESLFLPGRDSFKDLASIYQEIEKFGFPASSILIPTGNHCAPQILEGFHEAANAPQDRLQIIALNFVFTYALEKYKILPALRPLRESIKYKGVSFWSQWVERRCSKIAVFLNRKPKVIRLAMLAFLASRDYLERCHVSMMGEGKTLAKGRELEILLRRYADSYGIEVNDSQINSLAILLPIKLQAGETFSKGWDAAWSIPDISLFQESVVSLVSETLFTDGGSLYLTEKSAKPIALFHPFVIIGDPFSIEMIRGQGFRSFSPVLAERYDTIVPGRERAREIMKLVDWLAGLDSADIRSVNEGLCEHVRFNAKYFMKAEYRQPFVKSFLDSLNQFTIRQR